MLLWVRCCRHATCCNFMEFGRWYIIFVISCFTKFFHPFVLQIKHHVSTTGSIPVLTLKRKSEPVTLGRSCPTNLLFHFWRRTKCRKQIISVPIFTDHTQKSGQSSTLLTSTNFNYRDIFKTNAIKSIFHTCVDKPILLLTYILSHSLQSLC
jgi:hypothetical protein